ncbi:unnamed protein product [Thelazia callipaeda]|uniref:BZIP domain-containing protein n=1 Tax=Thelazia callipaeda TaxID=103827 RepID=A0A0N5CN26_THECL|nr:unnamed protein product [Thelazia callipaeda]
MDCNDNYNLISNDFNQFHSTNIFSPYNLELSSNNFLEESTTKFSNAATDLEMNVNSQIGNMETEISDFSIDNSIKIDDNFINQILCDSSSSSTSESENHSPTCSSDDQNCFDGDRINNVIQISQTDQTQTKITSLHRPKNLVPVHIPVQQLLTNRKNTYHPVIYIMPTSVQSTAKFQKPVGQIDQKLLLPMHHVSSPTLIHLDSTKKNGKTLTSKTLLNVSEKGLKHELGVGNEMLYSVGDISLDEMDYNRKKEIRKLRNRYSAQLSRIRKKNEIIEMKRNLAKKDAIIQDLKDEVTNLKKDLEFLRNENDKLKSKSVNRGNLGFVAGVTCIFGFVALFSLSNTYMSGIKSPSTKDLVTFSRSNMSNLANCDNASKKFLNETEAMRLNKDVFAWVNRHECLKFVHIRRIFRVPIQTREISKKLGKPVQKYEQGKKLKNGTSKQRTIMDKVEAARLKAVRERTWKHINMISSNGESTSSVRSQLKSMDYNENQNHFLANWLHHKPDSLKIRDMEFLYAELARNLKQRDDTLFVIAMKNYYLLPAIVHDGTVQPRLALILPALSFNGTLPNQVAMMRLECDITGTGLFHLPSSLLPLFYDYSSR